MNRSQISLSAPFHFGTDLNTIFVPVSGDPSQKEAAEEKHFLQVMQRTLENDDLNDQVIGLYFLMNDELTSGELDPLS